MLFCLLCSLLGPAPEPVLIDGEELTLASNDLAASYLKGFKPRSQRDRKRSKGVGKEDVLFPLA